MTSPNHTQKTVEPLSNLSSKYRKNQHRISTYRGANL